MKKGRGLAETTPPRGGLPLDPAGALPDPLYLKNLNLELHIESPPLVASCLAWKEAKTQLDEKHRTSFSVR